ncbi:RNA polymerase sigma factor (sigma-70 family) [Kibdelosporangium banguiense]|uniref:RNA polymerase sigma factor n=1 Tax=Kibdelosporangium banguiense TaxID=1365924 RepID=A0ABS4TL08_9PSEU|nr:sigma-70 family RNA polymerase sigma factor [Kibdelosporangium banguiense]MBP2325090.1 RNA polymerase sigma factor (sigma-70 family) [Kibdelosporangium banguiense]
MIETVWRLESAKIIAGVTRIVRDVGLAEELAQDALVAALEQWPESGVPDNPGAWLMAVAKRRAIDHIRRARMQDRKHEELAREQYEPEQDDVLRLIFLSCHPVLPTEAQVALTLRLVGGLTAAEIARAFLTTEQQISQRITAAKRTLAEKNVPFDLPAGDERLSSVLGVIYLIFNEGYSATSGDDLMRPGLCLEALRLGRLLAELAPHEAEVHGLIALMEIQASREAARTGPHGEPIQLHEQNRGRWDQLLIRRGFKAMLRARELGGRPGRYVLQAAIAVCHAQARTAQDTDWAQIAALYTALTHFMPTAIVQLNRAVAVGKAQSPQAGLDLVDSLTDDPALRDYHLLPSVRGDLLLQLERYEEARLEFARAAALTKNAAERAFLLHRAEEIEVPAGVTLGQSTQDFLAGFSSATARSYSQTLDRVARTLGSEIPLSSLTAQDITRVFTLAWKDVAPKTWNRHRAAIRSFGDWAELDDLAAGIERRPETQVVTEQIGPAELEALWAQDLPLRERTLWHMLYESSAGVKTVLSLNVENLDLEDRRAWAGNTWVSWRSETAKLLPQLVNGRTSGPLFRTSRRPERRLSYERAEYLFKQATGYTLSRLKSRRP